MYSQVRIFLFIIVISLFFGCCNSVKTSETEEKTIISYKDSLYIDFDFDKVSKHYSDRIARGDSVSIKKEENYQTLLIATDRFWRTVSYSNDQLESYLKSGEEINLSDRVFNGFLKQIKQGNNFIQESEQNGKKVIIGL